MHHQNCSKANLCHVSQMFIHLASTSCRTFGTHASIGLHSAFCLKVQARPLQCCTSWSVVYTKCMTYSTLPDWSECHVPACTVACTRNMHLGAYDTTRVIKFCNMLSLHCVFYCPRASHSFNRHMKKCIEKIFLLGSRKSKLYGFSSTYISPPFSEMTIVSFDINAARDTSNARVTFSCFSEKKKKALQ